MSAADKLRDWQTRGAYTHGLPYNALPDIIAVIAAAEKAHIEHTPSCAAHPYAHSLGTPVGPCDTDCWKFRLSEALAALNARLTDTRDGGAA